MGLYLILLWLGDVKKLNTPIFYSRVFVDKFWKLISKKRTLSLTYLLPESLTVSIADLV